MDISYGKGNTSKQSGEGVWDLYGKLVQFRKLYPADSRVVERGEGGDVEFVGEDLFYCNIF